MPSSISVASASSSSPTSPESCEEGNVNLVLAADVVTSVAKDSGEEEVEDEDEDEEEVDDEAKDEDSKRNTQDHRRQGKLEEEVENAEDNLDLQHEKSNPSKEQSLSVEAAESLNPSRPSSSRGSVSPGLDNAVAVPESGTRPAAEEEEDNDFPGAVLDAAESAHLIQELVDFVVGSEGGGNEASSVSLGELRTVLDEQIGRARRRMRGVEQINELLRSSELIPSAKYSLLNGWQGNVQLGGRRAARRRPAAKTMPQCLENIDLIPCYNRARILLAYSSVLEWVAEELQRLVRAAERQIRCRIPKGAMRMKESLNHRDLHGIGTLASSRFLLALLGTLTNAVDGQGSQFRITFMSTLILPTMLHTFDLRRSVCWCRSAWLLRPRRCSASSAPTSCTAPRSGTPCWPGTAQNPCSRYVLVTKNMQGFPILFLSHNMMQYEIWTFT